MLLALYLKSALVMAGIRARFDQLRREPDAGATTAEMVIVIALLAAAAITIVGIIVLKVTARANSINLGP